MNGWIRLDRKIQDSFMWDDPEALKLWLYLLMGAAIEDKTVSFNGKPLNLKRGQIVFGLHSASTRLGISVRRLRTTIKRFENCHQIDKQNFNKYSIISITNYCQYQDSDKQTPSKRQPKRQQLYNKQENNIFKPPTVEEVKAYCKERGNGIDAERFVDWYESKGWLVGTNKMKSWKATVRTWESRRKEQLAKEKPTASWEIEL
jgi:hypothetical protein